MKHLAFGSVLCTYIDSNYIHFHFTQCVLTCLPETVSSISCDSPVWLYPCAVMKLALALRSELSCTAAAQRTTTQPGARPENWPASWAPHWADQRERSSEQRWNLELVVLLVTEGQLLSCCQFPLFREFKLCLWVVFCNHSVFLIVFFFFFVPCTTL